MNLEMEGGHLSEKSTAKIIKQVLMAIKHMHDSGICHRDLKLENIMFETKGKATKDPMIKVIDFGFAKYFSTIESDLMTSRTGTPYYMAPEVLSGAYDKSCDLWAIGVMTYCLLAGYPPFNADSDAQLFRKIELCDYQFFEDDWS